MRCMAQIKFNATLTCKSMTHMWVMHFGHICGSPITRTHMLSSWYPVDMVGVVKGCVKLSINGRSIFFFIT